jgi:hypothetical protein
MTQVLARSAQGGLSTVQWIEIQSKIDSAAFVKKNLNGALLFSTRQTIQNYAADEAGKRDGITLEMGVYDGGSINLISKKLFQIDKSREVYGLDSFLGLEESWSATVHYQSFDRGGIPPKGIDPRVRIINGRVEEVLVPFLNNEKTKFALIHFDMDLYNPTKFALEKLFPFLKSGTLILFDELYGYPGWEFGEFKALNEVIPRENYRFLAFGPIQALIEIH